MASFADYYYMKRCRWNVCWKVQIRQLSLFWRIECLMWIIIQKYILDKCLSMFWRINSINTQTSVNTTSAWSDTCSHLNPMRIPTLLDNQVVNNAQTSTIITTNHLCSDPKRINLHIRMFYCIIGILGLDNKIIWPDIF